MGYILVLLIVDTLCHGQVLCSSVYSIVIVYHGKVSCLFIVNGDRHLVRDIEDILVSGHSEGVLCILKYLDLHGMILSYQQSELEVRHEDTSYFQG